MAADKPTRRRRPLSVEERALWDHVTRSVRRATETPNLPTFDDLADFQDAMADATKPKARKQSKTRNLPPIVATPAAPLKVTAPNLAPGVMPGMDRSTARRLKRGQLDIEATLDLHGHTQTAAHRALEAFLAASFNAGRRTVRVITGKGDREDGRPGVLKDAVPRWLNELPMRQWVAGFSYAPRQDGGEGALHIRVKRRR
tara:strand:- start:391541 stop:392140 length:600 start_codon:yes stop_codon:yes gene_type:complete